MIRSWHTWSGNKHDHSTIEWNPFLDTVGIQKSYRCIWSRTLQCNPKHPCFKPFPKHPILQRCRKRSTKLALKNNNWQGLFFNFNLHENTPLNKSSPKHPAPTAAPLLRCSARRSFSPRLGALRQRFRDFRFSMAPTRSKTEGRYELSLEAQFVWAIFFFSGGFVPFFLFVFVFLGFCLIFFVLVSRFECCCLFQGVLFLKRGNMLLILNGTRGLECGAPGLDPLSVQFIASTVSSSLGSRYKGFVRSEGWDIIKLFNSQVFVSKQIVLLLND